MSTPEGAPEMTDRQMPPDDTGLTDSVAARLGNVTKKALHIPEKIRPGRLLRRRHFEASRFELSGFVQARLFGPDGQLKQLEEGYNLVTDYGDEHVGERISLDAQDIVTGMRLGTGVTAASKAGAGAAIVTYLSGSFEILDAVSVGSDKGAGLGWRQAHVCTWIAGDITDTAIAEVVLSDENPLTDVAGVVGDTVARFVFGATIDKQAGDSLEVTWNLDVLGA